MCAFRLTRCAPHGALGRRAPASPLGWRTVMANLHGTVPNVCPPYKLKMANLPIRPCAARAAQRGPAAARPLAFERLGDRTHTFPGQT